MRSRRRTPEEQLRLVTECYQSGLTTFQWCRQNDVKLSTFYVWVNRLKQSGEIDTPAVIPTAIPRKAEQPDIVKIEIEGEKPLPTTMSSANAPIDEKGALPVAPMQTGYPVMEVILSGVQLRVTNEINPKLLADTLRLLRGGGC